MKSLIASVLCLVAPLSAGFALTGDDVAAFLQLSHWETTVTLPKESFQAGIFTIIDGKVMTYGARGTNGADLGGSPPKTRVVVMGQLNKSPAPFTLCIDGMTMRHEFDVPKTVGSVTMGLPREIGFGDYVLGGQLFDEKRDSRDVKSYKVGYLLRIEKN